MPEKVFVIFAYGSKTPIVACEDLDMAKQLVKDQADPLEKVSFEEDLHGATLGTIFYASGPVRLRLFIDSVPYLSPDAS